jgi:hypothetical protein
MKTYEFLVQEIQESYNIKNENCIDEKGNVLCEQLLVLTDMSVPVDAVIGKVDSIKKVNQIGDEYDYELNNDQYFMTYAQGDVINQY